MLPVLLLAPALLHAQSKDAPKPLFAEQMPVFPGNIGEWIGATIHYPDSARLKSVEGHCKVRFVVMDDGLVDSVSVVESSGNAYLDEEATRVVHAMPRWKPGVQDGKYVKVYYTLPFNFKLDAQEEKQKSE